MTEPMITCPECQTEIKLTESLAAPIIKSARREQEQRLEQKYTDIAKRENSLREREKELSQAKETIDEQVTEKLRQERAKIVAEESKKAKLALITDLEQKTKEITDLQEILKQKDGKLAEAQKAQAEVMRKQRELDDAKHELDITVEKRIQEGLATVREQAHKEAEDQLKLKVLEKEHTIASMQKQIEEILSHIRSLREVVGGGNIDGMSKATLVEIDTEICKVVTDVVKVMLPTDDTPYHHLATWIGGIQRAHPVEIFTPNYDLLMEQALEERRVPYFDGFVGSYRTFFDLTLMEQDNLPPRWARLWKVHGSFNWWRTSSGEVERRIECSEGDRQMIYPSHLKYYQSRRMPYLAMIDRLRAFLTPGQAVLITVGYSFSDQHLNDVILQGLSSNPTAICFGLLFGDRAKSPDAIAGARKQPNLSLLAADGAILGTIERDWQSGEKLDHPHHALAAQAGEMKNRSDAPEGRCKFLLGDFKSFGEFLSRQLVQHEDDKGD